MRTRPRCIDIDDNVFVLIGVKQNDNQFAISFDMFEPNSFVISGMGSRQNKDRGGVISTNKKCSFSSSSNYTITISTILGYCGVNVESSVSLFNNGSFRMSAFLARNED